MTLGERDSLISGMQRHGADIILQVLAVAIKEKAGAAHSNPGRGQSRHSPGAGWRWYIRRGHPAAFRSCAGHDYHQDSQQTDWFARRPTGPHTGEPAEWRLPETQMGFSEFNKDPFDPKSRINDIKRDRVAR